MSEKAVLTRWRCPHTRLWSIPPSPGHQPQPPHPPPQWSHRTGISQLPVQCTLTAVVLEHIELYNNDPAKHPAVEAIHNVYEIHSIEQTIQYLHATAGLPTKSKRIKSIRYGNYLAWPLITVKNVHKHFQESEETQKCHMQNQ